MRFKGFTNKRRPNEEELHLTVGNNEEVDVEFVDVILILDGSHRMTLFMYYPLDKI